MQIDCIIENRRQYAAELIQNKDKFGIPYFISASSQTIPEARACMRNSDPGDPSKPAGRTGSGDSTMSRAPRCPESTRDHSSFLRTAPRLESIPRSRLRSQEGVGTSSSPPCRHCDATAASNTAVVSVRPTI